MNPTAAAKLALRDQILAARRRLSLLDLGAHAQSLAAQVTQISEVRRAAVVAAYVSVGREPGTGPLIEELRGRDVRVLLPLLQPDNDLDWSAYDGPESLRSATRGLLEPTGPRLGLDAITRADVVLVPGLAVDRRGHRLGRGGGSYDRALARVPQDALVCALLHEGELVDEVPVEPHDRPVDAAATGTSLVRFEHA